MKSRNMLVLTVFVALSMILSACNNKLAAADGEFGKPSTWGDVVYTTTYSQAMEYCANLGQGVLGIAKNGSPTCGGPKGAAFWLDEGYVSQTTKVCPTRAEVNDLIVGVNPDGSHKDIVVEVSEEDGAWQINTGNPDWDYTVTMPLNVGLVATIHRPGMDKAEVFMPDGKKYQAYRGTFRFAGCYSLDDDMNQPNAWERILVKENFDGSFQEWATGTRVEDWTYSVLPGNFTCTMTECPTSNVSGNLSSNRSADLLTNCPRFAGTQTQPGNDGSPYCKYKGSKVTSMVPQNWKVDYWTGTAVAYAIGGDTITTAEATFRPIE